MEWMIGVPSYLFLALVAYHIEKRVMEESEMPALFAVFWPVRLVMLGFFAAIYLPSLAIIGAGWLVNEGATRLLEKTDGLVDRLLSRERPKVPKPEPVPRISIPKNAVLGSEEYRRLKPLVEQYEHKLPILERE